MSVLQFDPARLLVVAMLLRDDVGEELVSHGRFEIADERSVLAVWVAFSGTETEPGEPLHSRCQRHADAQTRQVVERLRNDEDVAAEQRPYRLQQILGAAFDSGPRLRCAFRRHVDVLRESGVVLADDDLRAIVLAGGTEERPRGDLDGAISGRLEREGGTVFLHRVETGHAPASKGFPAVSAGGLALSLDALVVRRAAPKGERRRGEDQRLAVKRNRADAAFVGIEQERETACRKRDGFAVLFDDADFGAGRLRRERLARRVCPTIRGRTCPTRIRQERHLVPRDKVSLCCPGLVLAQKRRYIQKSHSAVCRHQASDFREIEVLQSKRGLRAWSDI